MKRFFSMMLLLASLFTVGCDTEKEEGETSGAIKYEGTQTVTISGGPYAGAYNNPATIYVEECTGYVNVTLSEVCFTTGMGLTTDMPSLNIVLPNITESAVSGAYYIESATPTMTDGEPFGNDTIKSVDTVSVAIAGGVVTMSFSCTVYIDMYGTGTKSEVTFPVVFTSI